MRLWRLEHAVFELHEAGKSYKEEISVFIEKDARADARLRPAGAVCAGKGRGRAPEGYRVEPETALPRLAGPNGDDGSRGVEHICKGGCCQW